MNLDITLEAVAAFGATAVPWVLVLLGVAGLGSILERGVCFWTTRDDLESLAAELGRRIRDGQWQKASQLLSESPSFEARVALAAVGRDDADSADQLMLGASQNARLELERHLGLLSIVGNIAPFVGVLGTVLGVIRELGELGELDEARGVWTGGLVRELGEALLSTAAGLMVALPAVVALECFRCLAAARLTRADALRRLVLGELHARRGR